MDQAWISVVGTLAGTIVGAAVTGVLAALGDRRATRRENRSRWLEARRDLYTRALSQCEEWQALWRTYAYGELSQWDEDSTWLRRKDEHERERESLRKHFDRTLLDLSVIGATTVRDAVVECELRVRQGYVGVLRDQERGELKLGEEDRAALAAAARTSEEALDHVRTTLRDDLLVD